jgi:hypothetical protein
MLRTSATNVDPMMTVLREGGPYHSRGKLPGYLDRLRSSERAHLAQRLIERHPQEAGV